MGQRHQLDQLLDATGSNERGNGCILVSSHLPLVFRVFDLSILAFML